MATFTADDPEGATSITWSIAGTTGAPALPTNIPATDNADSASFEIDKDGVLKFSSSPDYEASTTGDGGGDADNDNTYKVVVAASDGVAAPDTGVSYHKVTVEVTDVDEPGKVTWTVDPDGTGTLDAATVNGGSPIMQFQVGATLTASVTDGDIAGPAKAVASPGATAPIWRWYKSSSMSSMGTLIDGADTNAYTVGLDDVGMYIRVVAHYVVAGNVDQETAPLTSDYPVLAARVGDHDLEFDPDDPSREVAEGDKGMMVGAPVTATGNHGVVNYVLTGADADRFEIDAKTGQITTKVDLDYEGEAVATADTLGSCADASAGSPDRDCTVTVTATDASGEATGTPATVSIEITDVDEKPTFSAGAEAVSVAENSKEVRADSDNDGDNDSDDTANPYAAMDPEGLNVNLTLMGPDAARFTLSAGTGGSDLSFVKAPNYEMPGDADGDNMYEVTVRASDGTMTADRMVKVSVTNVNEAPEIIADGLVVKGPASVSVEENTPATTAVATYTAAGPDADSATWSLSGDDSGDFTITGGMLRFRTSPDYENPADTGTNNMYEVTVTANDGTNEDTRQVTVTVTNVEEGGTVTLSSARPAVGVELTATLTDLDGMVSGETWQWASENPDGTYTDIAGATSASYTPVAGDAGKRLRATVEYTDGYDSDNTEMKISDNAVTAGDPLVVQYDANNNGMIDKDEVIQAIDDYLFEGGDPTPSKDDVVKLIGLYLFG